MTDFFPLLAALQARLEAPGSAFQASCQAHYGRAAAVHLDRVPERDVKGGGPQALLLDGDEAVAAGADKGALGGLKVVREVAVAIAASKLASPAEHLNALATAVIEDLHHQGLPGALRVEYAGGGRDDLEGNAALFTAVFRILYQRR